MGYSRKASISFLAVIGLLVLQSSKIVSSQPRLPFGLTSPDGSAVRSIFMPFVSDRQTGSIFFGIGENSLLGPGDQYPYNLRQVRKIVGEEAAGRLSSLRRKLDRSGVIVPRRHGHLAIYNKHFGTSFESRVAFYQSNNAVHNFAKHWGGTAVWNARNPGIMQVYFKSNITQPTGWAGGGVRKQFRDPQTGRFSRVGDLIPINRRAPLLQSVANSTGLPARDPVTRNIHLPILEERHPETRAIRHAQGGANPVKATRSKWVRALRFLRP